MRIATTVVSSVLVAIAGACGSSSANSVKAPAAEAPSGGADPGTQGGNSANSGNGGSSVTGGDAASAAGGSVNGGEFLRVSGVDIVDGAGQKVFLRGLGLGNWLLPEGYMWKFASAQGDRPRRIEARVQELLGAEDAELFWTEWRAQYIAEQDIARISELGFNSVRLAINARQLLPEGQEAFNEQGFAYIEDLVHWSRAHKIYVIFDMHAAPGGQTGANIDDSINDYPDLFNSEADQARLVKLWTEIARRHAHEPAVLGYDLLNEPLPYNDSAKQLWLHNPKLYPLYERITQGIRSVDRNHLVIVEGAHWGSDWTALGPPFDLNQVYSFHMYTNDRPSSAMIQKYVDARTEWQRPVWVGETGENDLEWYRSFIGLLEENNMGWSFWPWKKMDSANGPYSYAKPNGWDGVVEYVDRGGAKPSADAAKATFNELLKNIRLANSVYNEPVVCAILRCP